MRNKKLIIYGTGGFAEYAAYVFENDSPYTVVAFSMESSYFETVESSKKTDLIIYETLEEHFSVKDYELFVAVGNNIIRERIFLAAKQKGYRLAKYISSKAVTWNNLKIGENSFVGEGSILQAFTEIGENSILFGARTGHHTKIGNHSLISGSTTGGNVSIGDHSFLGLNSCVKQNVKVGAKNIIGMGVIITHDTYEKAVYSSPGISPRNLNFDDIHKNYLK